MEQNRCGNERWRVFYLLRRSMLAPPRSVSPPPSTRPLVLQRSRAATALSNASLLSATPVGSPPKSAGSKIRVVSAAARPAAAPALAALAAPTPTPRPRRKRPNVESVAARAGARCARPTPCSPARWLAARDRRACRRIAWRWAEPRCAWAAARLPVPVTPASTPARTAPDASTHANAHARSGRRRRARAAPAGLDVADILFGGLSSGLPRSTFVALSRSGKRAAVAVQGCSGCPPSVSLVYGRG